MVRCQWSTLFDIRPQLRAAQDHSSSGKCGLLPQTASHSDVAKEAESIEMPFQGPIDVGLLGLRKFGATSRVQLN